MTLVGIGISSIPMIGAWAASKWMIPWADKAAGPLFTALGGNYPKVGALCALVYALGMIAIWGAPDTGGRTME
jgi:hypothetical protein